MSVNRMTALGAIFAMAMAAGCAAAPVEATTTEPAADANAVSAAVLAAWRTARLNLKESAELMAEDGYAFRPVDTVRTFGQLLTHVAGANYVFCSAARGEPSPNDEGSFEDTVTARDEIIRVLEESLAYCDAAYESATDANLADTVTQPFGGAPGPRAAVLVGNINHLNEHYGNLVTYFRVSGIVPPSSRR